MLINYSDETPNLQSNLKKIFLAGPTPRTKEIKSWRIEALMILKEFDYDGIVYVPERNNYIDNFDYNTQVLWEKTCLMNSDIIVFWIPRNLKNMPGFTTNVEFGYYLNKKYCLLGHPDDAENMRYLDWLYKSDTNREPINDLKELLSLVI